MKDYWDEPKVHNFIKCKLQITFWKVMMRLMRVKGMTQYAVDRYGLYLRNEVGEKYYFQYRFNDWKKLKSYR